EAGAGLLPARLARAQAARGRRRLELQGWGGPHFVDTEPVGGRAQRGAEVELVRRRGAHPLPHDAIPPVVARVGHDERRASVRRLHAAEGRRGDAAEDRVTRAANVARLVGTRAGPGAPIPRARVTVIGARAPARLEPAGGRAAVAVEGVAVIALLAPLHDAVAAVGWRADDVEHEVPTRLRDGVDRHYDPLPPDERDDHLGLPIDEVV